MSLEQIFLCYFQSSSNIVRFCKMGKLFKWINFNMIYLFINIYLINFSNTK